jgi:CDGSH-type Zn-finger protein
VTPPPDQDVVCCPDGPLLLRGDYVVVDDDGAEHSTRRPVSAVCRCGHTATKPWCDGTHKIARHSAPTSVIPVVRRRSLGNGEA